MRDYKILFLLPSRSRPEKFKRLVESVQELVSSDSYLINATLDWNDETMRNPEMHEFLRKRKNMRVVYGHSTGKINAINRDINEIEYPWDIVVLLSDDFEIGVAGFDSMIRAAFDQYGLDSVCHWPDGTPVRERLITMSVMGRPYFDRFKFLYHPDYVSLWADNEFTECAKMLGCYHYMGGPNHNNVWATHFHPAHMPNLVMDEQLRRTESFYHIDEQTYHKRKARNFDL